MAAEKALFSILTSAGGVTSLVSDRVYPVTAPQGTALPYITYQQISGPRAYEVDGAMGWVESRYQITAWSATYKQACDISDAIQSAISGYSGTVAELDIDHIFVTDEGDMSSLFADNDALDMHGKRIDALITFRE